MKRWRIFRKAPECKGILKTFLEKSKELDKEYFDKRRKMEAEYGAKLSEIIKKK